MGVAALLITLAVLDGFRSDIQDKILGTQPHLFVVNPFGGSVPYDPTMTQRLSTAKHVQAAAPFIYGQALIQSGSSVTGIMLRGIVPTDEARVTRIGSILTEGHWDALDTHSVALGQELARTIGAHTGDTVTLITPQQQESGSWSPIPRMRKFKVAGIFRSGMYEYDANLAYLNIPAAQDLLGLGNHVTGYGMRLDNVDNTDAARCMTLLNETYGNVFWIRSWQDLNRNLFSAMKLERTMMFLIVTLIILVASFTIISNLLLLTIEKAREIPEFFRRWALRRCKLAKIFLFNGLMLGEAALEVWDSYWV